MNKQQLASKIWESANRMRSKIEANEYKDYILGFIFYKFLSDKEVRYLRENDWTDEYLPELTEEDSETVESIRKNLGYFIAYDNLFSSWHSAALLTLPTRKCSTIFLPRSKPGFRNWGRPPAHGQRPSAI